MRKTIETMAQIQEEKKKETAAREPLPLDAEGKELAEGKRLTFDVLHVDTDPLR